MFGRRCTLRGAIAGPLFQRLNGSPAIAVKDAGKPPRGRTDRHVPEACDAVSGRPQIWLQKGYRSGTCPKESVREGLNGSGRNRSSSADDVTGAIFSQSIPQGRRRPSAIARCPLRSMETLVV